MPKVLGKDVGSVGFGLMSFTWRPVQIEDSVAFDILNRAIQRGATIWSSCEFYGPPKNARANLKLLRRYFDKYPENIGKVILAIKGCMVIDEEGSGTFKMDASASGIRSSVANIQKELGDIPIDIFLPARLPPGHMEEAVKTMNELRSEGKINGIGLSEVGASTLQKASSITKIDLAEIELSMSTLDPRENGILDACAENKIPVIGYSPLGRGLLTGQIRSREDFDEGDFRLHMPRFSEENFSKNLDLVDRLQVIAKNKRVPVAALAIAWCIRQKGTVIPIPGCTKMERLEENLRGMEVDISKDEMDEIESLLSKVTIHGDRYPSAQKALLDT